MNEKEYRAIFERMVKYNSETDKCGIKCTDCPLYVESCLGDRNIDVSNPYIAIEIVEEWEKTNPLLKGNEKAYLKAIIEPFKKDVLNICKNPYSHKLVIKYKVESLVVNNVEYAYIPIINDSWFENMANDVEYELSELGLD